MHHSILAIRKNSSSEAGFTFVEVLMTTILLSFLSIIIFGSISGIVRGRENLQSRSRSVNVARTVLERITRELGNRALEPLARNQQNNSEGSSENTPNRFGRRAFMEGTGGGEGKDKLRFTSSGTAQAAYGAFTNYGLVEIQYRLEEDPDSEGDQTYFLVREENPVGVEDEDTRNSRRVVFPLASDITALGFRFLENAAWKDSWNGVALPEAIEITIKIRAENGEETPFRTAVAINKRRRGLSSLRSTPQ